MFSRAWLLVHIFLRLASGSYFPALCFWFMFSRAWQLVHVFLRLATNTCFPNSHTAYKGYLAARAPYNSPQTFSWYKDYFQGNVLGFLQRLRNPNGLDMVGIISSGNFLTFLGENEKAIVFSPVFFFL